MSETQKLREALRFTKKPVTIEATQWFKHGDHAAVTSIPADHPIDRNCIDPSVFGWVPTLEGGHVVTPGDWIITGVKGEHYPCKPDIFAATYDPADKQALALPTAEQVDDINVAESFTSVTKTAAPVGEREAFEQFAQNCPMGKYNVTRRGEGYDSSHTQIMWAAWQARAALSAGDAADAQPHAVITGKLGTLCSFNSSELRKGDPIYTAAQIDAAMRKGQL